MMPASVKADIITSPIKAQMKPQTWAGQHPHTAKFYKI
jgi:hypothetical protein